MSRIVHPQFRHENEAARYPFTDNSTLEFGTLSISPQLFLDAVLYPVSNSTALKLRAVTIDGLLITLEIGTVSTTLCSAAVDLVNAPADGLLEVIDTQGRPAGSLLTTPSLLPALKSWPLGTTNVPAGVAEFVASCVIARPETGVRSLRAEDGDGLYGDVWLVGGNGVIVRDDDNALRIDVVGEPLSRRQLCGNTGLFTTPSFVRTINGIQPTPWGGFTINPGWAQSAKNALRIYPDGGNLVIGLAIGN